MAKFALPDALKAEVPPTTWGRILAATPVVMTVVATALAGLASSEMTRAQYGRSLAAQQQSKAGDQWGFFQAKRLRSAMQRNALDILQNTADVHPLDPAVLAQAGIAPDSPAVPPTLAALQKAELPPFAVPPLPVPQMKATLDAIEDQKLDAEVAALLAPVKDKTIADALREARDRAHAFEVAVQPINQAVDKLEKFLVGGDKSLNRDFTAARLRYTAARNDAEARLNQAIANLYELQVRKGNMDAERHHKRSRKFFYGMLGAQAAVIIATFSLAAQRRSLLWSLAETNALAHTVVAGDLFIATGSNGTLITSADGVNWSRRAVDATNVLGEVAWHAGTFAVAEEGAAAVFTSHDAVEWTRLEMPPNVASIVALLAWEEGFSALVNSGPYGPNQMLRSTDGIAWLPETPPANDVASLAVGGGRLLAFRGSGSRTFHARRAGETNWSTHVLPWVSGVNRAYFYAPAGAAFGTGTFLLTHSAGFLLQSEPLTAAAPSLHAPLVAVAAAPTDRVTLRVAASGSTPLYYQWQRNGTNVMSAFTPFLTLPASDVAAHRITVVIANAFGRVASEPAAIFPAEPVRLELAPDLAWLRVWGTPYGRYRIEGTEGLSATAD